MMLRTEQLGFRFGEKRVLDDVDLTLREGEFVFLLGASGAGKTTLLKILAGLLAPSVGSVRLDGQEIARMNPRARAVRIGLMLQDAVPPFDYTAEEFVLLGRTARLPRFSAPSKEDRRAVRDAVAAVGMEWGLKRPVDAFSGGEFQRLRLAAVLSLDSDILLLDEPFSSQDPAQTEAILELLKQLSLKKLVVVTTHLISAAEKVGSRALLLAENRIFADGEPKKLLTEENYRRLYLRR
jgi:iron complex transport system ATP-binding protein